MEWSFTSGVAVSTALGRPQTLGESVSLSVRITMMKTVALAALQMEMLLKHGPMHRAHGRRLNSSDKCLRCYARGLGHVAVPVASNALWALIEDLLPYQTFKRRRAHS